MSNNRSIEELEALTEDEQYDYLVQKDVFTEEEWELYKEVSSGEYRMREITRKSFERNGNEYLVSVENWSDGEKPDKMNTRVNIVTYNSD